jgi:hypothetical protein
MSEHPNTSLVERLFSEVWGDPEGSIPDDLIHEEFWSSEPGVSWLSAGSDGGFVASHTGVDALAREVAVYRDFYRDLTLGIVETFEGEPTGRGEVAVWEEERMRGEVVVVHWTAGATHPTATFTTRGGTEEPLRVGGRGMSLVRILDGRIRSADKFWERDSEILARMTEEPEAPGEPAEPTGPAEPEEPAEPAPPQPPGG